MKKNVDQEILDSYNRDEWKSLKLSKRDLAKYQKYAAASLAKDKRINIRIPSALLESIQMKAAEEGLPYQTFISSILHKFTTGRLKDTALSNKAPLPYKPRRKN